MEKISRIFLIISHLSQTFFANFSSFSRYLLPFSRNFSLFLRNFSETAHREKEWGNPRSRVYSYQSRKGQPWRINSALATSNWKRTLRSPHLKFSTSILSGILTYAIPYVCTHISGHIAYNCIVRHYTLKLTIHCPLHPYTYTEAHHSSEVILSLTDCRLLLLEREL